MTDSTIVETESYQAFIDRLVAAQKLRPNDLSRVKKLQGQLANGSLPALLIKLGLCAERDVAQALAESAHIHLVTSDDYPPACPLSEDYAARFKRAYRFLKEHHVVPLQQRDDALTFAVMDPFDRYIKQSLSLVCDKPLSFKVGVSSEIDQALEVQFAEGKSEMDKVLGSFDGDDFREDDIEHLKELASEAPVIRMVNLVLQRALETRASDIHIEPFEQSLKVRLRIDGVLQHIEAPPVSSTAAVISRIKLMAKLNISERRLPQDGRIKIQMQGKEIDLRVSTTPTLYGESVVIRILDKGNVVLEFNALGFDRHNASRFFKILAEPHGIILITGPTGSGKSTTLYTALSQLNVPGRKIITVEDPVEYQLEGVNQIQVKPQIGLNFSTALRSIVRQDPDVIMIGEMRDLETARIAVQSALTGHLVLSTLHTNDAASGITRLLDMGLEDYLLTSTVNGILAQRLVRRLCAHCREPYTALPEVAEEMRLRRFVPEGDITLWRPKGCPQCGGFGYQGRFAIFEFLTMTDSLRKLIMAHEDAEDIAAQAIAEGMRTMYEDGVAKALQGLTSLEEVLRVTAMA